MFYRRGFIIACVFMLTILLASCSGGNSPITPDTDNQFTQSRTSSSDSDGSRILWGYWDVMIEPSSGDVEIVPLRNAMFNANVTRFMQAPLAPVNLIKFIINPVSDFTTGFVDVDVTLEHPFKSLPQFRGFDVRGIFLTDGSKTIESVPGLVRAQPDETRLLNADGYSRWWNASEFGPEGTIFGYQFWNMGFPDYPAATVNPYKYFADELDETAGVETLDPMNRGTFSTNPGLNTRNYVIQFEMDGPNPIFKFQFAVDASWDKPDPAYAPDYPVEAYSVSAQMQEPYNIVIEDAGSTAWYETSTQNGGEFIFGIEVFDWQTPESGLSDQLGALFLESSIFAGVVDVLPTAVEMPGSVSTSRIYSVVMDDLILTHAGEEEIFVVAQSAFGTYMPNIEGGEVFTYPDEPLAAFMAANLTILDESPKVDSWPMAYYDYNNSSYNPDSNVTYPLNLVYEIDHTFNSHAMLVIDSENIFLTDPNDYLRVLDVTSGAELWSKQIKTEGSFWTGCPAALWNNDVIIGGTGIHSYEIDTQAENWHSYPTTGFEHQGQVIVGDTIFFKGSDNSLVSINASDGSENWATSWTTQPLFPPVYGEVGGQGYVAAPYGSSVRCVNADTGSQVWTQSIGGSCFHNPVVIGDYVYFGFYTTYKNHLETGVTEASVDLVNYAPMGMWRGPDAIYMTARNHQPDPDVYKLYKFDFDLVEQWSVDIPGNCDNGTFSGGVVWLAGRFESDSFQLRAFDPDNGDVLYTDLTEFNYAWGGITNVDNKLFFCDNHGHLACFETE